MAGSCNGKILGSILMLLGTCVGGAMLALPLSAAQYSYSTTLFYLIIVWSFTTIGALALLEVHLWMPSGSNFFTMTRKTLGSFGNFLSLIIYLLLLYSLIAAYIVGSSDIFQGLLSVINVELSRSQSTLIVFAMLFIVVAHGIRIIDLTNRFLMLLKLIAFVMILSLMLGKLNGNLVNSGASISSLYAVENFKHNLSNFLIIVTSFGFGSILPSLRAYLEDDQKSLTLILILGCIIPLVLYALWILSVHGLISKEGVSGLIEISRANNPNTELINAISLHTGSGIITKISRFFVSICTLTAFLGVSLSLVDFIRDMVNNLFIGKDGSHKLVSSKNFRNILVYVLSFGVPLTIALFSPGIFLIALSYAGIMVLMFLVLLPLLMLYRGRYQLGFTGKSFMPGGKPAVLFFISTTSILILFAIRSVFV